MKLRITNKWAAITAIAAIALVAIMGCTVEETTKKTPEAKLFSVTVNNIKVTVEQEAIPGEDWDDEDIVFDLGEYDTLIVSSTNVVDARITTEASDGARVQWGRANGSNRPDSFNDRRVPASFTVEDYLYFKVTASDGITANYYRFNSFVASPVKELANLTIAGRDPNTITPATGDPFKVPPPAADFDSVRNVITNNLMRGQIDLTYAERLAEIVVAAEPQDEKAQVRFAVAETAAIAREEGTFIRDWTVATSEVFVDEVSEKETPMKVDNIQFADGNILFVEVTAQNDDKNYYGFQVTAGRLATVARLDFDGLEVTGKGTPAAQLTSTQLAPGAYASADQQADGFEITIIPDDPEAKVDYGLINSVSLTTAPTYGTPNKILFQDGNALVIRVQSARGTASDTRYYKIGIELLAAKFKHQPKPAAYYYFDENEANYDIDTSYAHVNMERYGAAVRSYENKNWYTRSYTKKNGKWYDSGDKLVIDPDSTVWTVAAEPLDFELDRDVPGATYQWYESNSLYGGYGFDREGRIYGEVGYGDDVTLADNVYGITGANILRDVKDILGSGLDWDEKTNISLHNGGNQYYRLPLHGRPIPGEINPTYTPKFDYRPFLTGFTSEVHYYWVVVTSPNGQKATSQRAVIVSERSSEKKHYNVDLNAYLNVDADGNILPGTIGLLDPPRNAEPFKAGNHGDKYLMRITFPPGFDIFDYTTVTAQAIFYLRDGREWIQNWTQGDFGFENDGSPVVLWYNLTNDNATRGLASSGNEPSGGALNIIPSHLVVKPAGTKPLKDLPPFNDDKTAPYGQPVNTNNAQGWFTPYIQIVDLRFEGPARAPPAE